MSRRRKYPTELIDRGARLVFESCRPTAHVAYRLAALPDHVLKPNGIRRSAISVPDG